ncbi:hypothetical protein sos41_12130 [Alphaproteobacteria bacterium SO-S41]|nr:hypothetical protein sos41_12130 [Alphaproteobacteria bacterium SO-S41]
MRQAPGEKIGEGATADIHAWAPGQVLKLFKASLPRFIGEHEARMTRAAFAAGAPAPEVLDEVTIDGRLGIVLPRLDGPTLLQSLLSGAISSEDGGAILAALYRAVHATPPPAEAPSLREWCQSMSQISDGMPAHIVAGVFSLVERLPPGDGLCHADLHPGNVIMTAEGPRIIDWVAMVRAPAALDLARSHLTLHELVHGPDDVDPTPPRALNAALLANYARAAGVSVAALETAMTPYLPLLRALVLAEQISPAQRARLIQSVEAAFAVEG